ncbi:MAG: Spy/CpxP family protein refolding chaperone [Acetobacteraceae bacterium]|nr:Spy/CpxP family protein refolding chaperone [Acetobacteraceae bacterium]
MRTIAATTALSLLAALAGPAAAAEPPFRLAMMDMMPMGGGTAPAPMQAPGSMPMGDNAMRMGSSQPPAAPSAGMPMRDDAMAMGMAGGGQAGAMGANQMCAMMQAMMQAMMRSGGAQGAMGPMGAAPSPAAPAGSAAAMQGSSAARLEGRIAFIRAELRITDAQARAWDTFAAALRASRNHLDEAREVLHTATGAADPMARLQAYEAHLAARAEAVRSSRLAFDALFAQLDDAQKRAATGLMLPFIGAF